MGHGIAHGEFAWFIRSHDAVLRLWRHVFAEADEPLCGTIGSPALSPPPVRPPKAYGCKASKLGDGQWLHVDYSPPLPEQMYQSCVHLSPAACGATGWARVGLMVCMAPSSAVPEEARALLLAACVRGDAARATAGLKFGICQPIAPYPPKKGLKRLKPILSVDEDAQIETASGRPLTVEKARTLAPDKLALRCNIEALRRVVHTRALSLIDPEGALALALVPDGRVSGNSSNKRPRLSDAPGATSADSSTTAPGRRTSGGFRFADYYASELANARQRLASKNCKDAACGAISSDGLVHCSMCMATTGYHYSGNAVPLTKLKDGRQVPDFVFSDRQLAELRHRLITQHAPSSGI